MFLSINDHSRAIQFFRAAIREEPSMADAHTNLGVTLFMIHQNDEAVAALTDSFWLRPSHPENLLNLGYALWRTDDLDGAVLVLRHAVEVFDLPQAHIALGSVYFEQGDNEAAIEHCRKGLLGEPDSLLGYDTIREVSHYLGDEKVALEACDALIERFPGHQQHAYKRALVMLSYDNPAGWAGMECRYEASSDGFSQMGREDPYWFSRMFGRRWDGRPTGHLLVQTEQGFGDVIQFLRYLPMAAERCETLSLQIPESLRRIVRQSFKLPNLHLWEAVADHFDHYCLVMSLPHLLDATATIPTDPYLIASPHKYGEVRSLDGVKIGLAWAGSLTHPDDRARSIPLEKLARLFGLPAHFVSLQIPCADNLRQYPIIDVHPTQTLFGGKLGVDWSETAALIDTLDLVITVDTAVLHMAGALGKPVWMLNRYNTDWRWGLKRSDSAWYPKMRIFRQPKMRDWDSVLDAVHQELAALLDGGLTPAIA